MNQPEKLAILCAGPGFGFYIPGLIMNRQFNKAGLNSIVYVFESLLMKEKQQNMMKAKERFHNNFSFALIGQTLAKDPTPFLDANKIDDLFSNWKKENVTGFISLSGFWIPVLEKYLNEKKPPRFSAICCHLDSANSTSWNLFQSVSFHHQHLWFFNWDKMEISFHLNVDNSDPIPYRQRENRLIIHGGGWGIGTYREKIETLNKAGFLLDVIAYQKDDLHNANDENHYFLIDPEWKSWEKDPTGNFSFPSFSNANKDFFKSDADSPEIYQLIKKNKAIISKPGAGTLIDSLSSSTPLVYLEPFGDYERKNALLWEHYGLGISYEKWEASNFSEEILEKVNRNLVERRGMTKNFVNFIKNENGT